MYHQEVAHYEGDPRHDEAVAIDDAYRRSLAETFDSKTVDAIMHGEVMDGKGRVISALGDAFMTSAYGAGVEAVTEYESMNPLEIVAAELEAEANPDEGGKYDGVRDVMRHNVDLGASSSKNPKRRIDPSLMMRPSSEEAHRKLMSGRPCKGDKPRVHITARIDSHSRDSLRDAGLQPGEALDLIATYIDRGMTSTQIREALQNAVTSGNIKGITPNHNIVARNIDDLPMCA